MLKPRVFALLISFMGALLYAIFATIKFTGDKLFIQYYYVVPIVFPFIAFLFDRFERFSQRTKIQHLIDALVTLTAMWRVFGDVPYISGHTLFLSYALMSSCSRIVQITSVIVLIEVLYLKYFVWNDWITPTTGMILGSLAAFISWWIDGKNVKN